MSYIKPYLVFNCAVWMPWGLICIFDTGQIASIIGVTSVDATGNTDLRVMYGGFQFAVGLMAAAALYEQRLFKNFVYITVFAFCNNLNPIKITVTIFFKNELTF